MAVTLTWLKKKIKRTKPLMAPLVTPNFLFEENKIYGDS